MATAAASIDDTLLAEIAPAMLAKLQRDGRAKGFLIGVGSVLVAIAVSQQLAAMARLFHDDYLFAVGAILLAVAAVPLVLLPPYLRQKNVSAELTCRRQHGKWRWER